ncbi:hypothetical protein [Polaromonas sp.]|uniref:hypothetical protein n=1 Tax=Polaromonas sp. TaxID=1869339 RepID=UPI0037CA60F4
MMSFRLVSIIAITAALGLAGCAQTRYGHMAPAGGQAMPMAGPGGPMARMDEHMMAMRAMHDRVSRARTPEERNALMAEQQKLMQEGMGMMGGMGPGGMGGMMGPGPGPMGGDPAARQQWMEKRMEMMQSMMQMMMDRLPPPPAKP